MSAPGEVDSDQELEEEYQGEEHPDIHGVEEKEGDDKKND
jgi:hypothetical protein